MLFTQYQVKSLTRKGPGFVALFDDTAPANPNMGVIVGYANRAQLAAGRMRFEIKTSGNDTCTLTPKDDATAIPSPVLREQAIHFLIEVGFMPETARPGSAIPTTEITTFTDLAQATA